MTDNKLKYLRTIKGISRTTIATYLDVTPSAYGNYENGKRNIDSATLIKIADYYNVSTDYILNHNCDNYSDIIAHLQNNEDLVELLETAATMQSKYIKFLNQVLKIFYMTQENKK